MNSVLKKLKDISAPNCITIILNTHRTHPANEQDALVLKNLVAEASSRLHELNDTRLLARNLSEKLETLALSIDHQHNLESLVLFVNNEIAEYVRLAVPVTNRVIIDNTFATRDLIRAYHMEASYYVLVLSRQLVRLIEASSDKPVAEILNADFPMELDTWRRKKPYTSDAPTVRALMLDTFADVDAALAKILAASPLPVVVCTEESNYHEYVKASQHNKFIVGHLNKNRLHETPHHIIDEAWPIVKQVTVDKIAARKEELLKAINTNAVVTDLTNIWKALNEGRGKTLFVQKGFYQRARIENDIVLLVADDAADEQAVIDDVIDELIEVNLAFGGDTVFLPEEKLEKFNGVALITRY